MYIVKIGIDNYMFEKPRTPFELLNHLYDRGYLITASEQAAK